MGIMAVSMVSAEEIWSQNSDFNVGWDCPNCVSLGSYIRLGRSLQPGQTIQNHITGVDDYENVRLSFQVMYHKRSSGWDEDDDDRIHFDVWDGDSWEVDVYRTPENDGERYDGDGRWHGYTFSIPDSVISDDFRIRLRQGTEEEGKEYCYIDDFVLTGDRKCDIYRKYICGNGISDCGDYGCGSAYDIAKSWIHEGKLDLSFDAPSAGSYECMVTVKETDYESPEGSDQDDENCDVYINEAYLGRTNDCKCNSASYCSHRCGPCTTSFTENVSLSMNNDLKLRGYDSHSVQSVEICCFSIRTTIREAFWTDLEDDSVITEADFNDTVRLLVAGSFAGEEVDYVIKEKNSLFGIDWLWPDIQVAQETTRGYTTWQADREGDFYFEASVGDELPLQSGYLAVSEESDNISDDDTAPQAIIITPEDGLFCSVDFPIDFTQESIDEDDLLKITWGFGNGAERVFENYSKEINPYAADTTYSYNNSGAYNILLTAEEMTRPLSDTDSVSIEILKEGINVMPIITEPVGSTGYGNIVEFNASQSHVLNCSYNQSDCPNGECDIVACNLYCYYLHEPGKLTTDSDYDLYAEWAFPTDPGVDGVEGDWSNETAMFTKFFPTAGSHTARLRLTYTEI